MKEINLTQGKVTVVDDYDCAALKYFGKFACLNFQQNKVA